MNYDDIMSSQSWTWIGSIHGLDWIGLGPMTAILCFFSFIYFLYYNRQTLSL